MSNNTDTLQRGDKIGCYRIEQVLGRGGFAVTYLATDENLDVEVAIKEYLPREITQRDDNLQVSARKPEFVEDYDVGLENFARESKTLARFKHPHIVRVHQVLHENNTAYMVMDFEHGQELGEILEQKQTLSEEELRNILFPILDGVEEIHRHGFVHRDIKPSNIYVRHNGSPVLIDFGAARYTMSETTQQLTAVVTVGYTPIEQYNVSEDKQGAWSDIYALAAVCYEAVTGDVPADSVTRASASVTNGDDPLPTVRQNAKRDYSDDCLDAIDWGLRMEAEDRPQVIAQWRDSFDGIFNPASAYVAKKNVSIYSPHRVDKPLRSGAAPTHAATGQRTQQPLAGATAARLSERYQDDDISIPLGSTETPLDGGIISLETDPDVTDMPPVPREPTERRPSDTPPSLRSNGDNITRHPSTRASDSATENDPAQRNVLRRDTVIDSSQHTQQQFAEQPPTRSKFERPSHIEPKKRVIREDIEFDDSEWDYEPPGKSSPLKLLLPALGLAAIVGASILMVNYPELINNFLNKDTELSSEEALELAELKTETNSFIFPEGDSALDYYQLALKSEPDNEQAQAGIRSIETTVREMIADNMEQNNLSEANRILARADDAGLRGVYNIPAATAPSTQTVEATETTEAQSSPIITPTDSTVITPVDTAPLERNSATPELASNTQEPEVVQREIQAATTPTEAPSNGIDNSISPFIEGKIAEINTLIAQERFAEARTVYVETNRLIPDRSVARQLLRQIEFGEAETAAKAAASEAASEAANEAASTVVPSNNTETPADNTLQASTTDTLDTATPLSTATDDTTIAPEPPRNSFIDARGEAADHLNKLRLALEAKDIDAVQSLSQPLPEGRIRFLTSTFARHHRLDVIIDNVTTSGDTISGRLNVAMYGKADDGSVYSAGKWNGAIIEATRANGEWQKIRW